MVTSEPFTMRVPKTAELVASQIRGRIIRGELREDDALPPESDLMAQFGVSRPTLREGFRILESEGLIVVRRGARGGARVRLPDHEVAARFAGLVLQYRGATLADVFQARTMIEAPAARMLAASKNRAEVTGRLQAFVDEHAQDLRNTSRAPGFHRLVVELTGNQTLILLTGMLEDIAEAAAISWERQNPPSLAEAQRAHRGHQRLVELVRAGAAEKAELFWRAHLDQVGAVLMKVHGGSPTTVVDVLT
jgi:DNA-binding FadR family transcriptional regulator